MSIETMRLVHVIADRTVRVPRGLRSYIFWNTVVNNLEKNGPIAALGTVLAYPARKALAYGMRGLLLFDWLTSPRVSDEEQDVRDSICDTCEHLDATNSGPARVRFCKACGCPKTRYSELTVKNSRRDHNCPEGRHPGSVALPVELRVGCNTPGCGGGSGGVAQPPPQPAVLGGVANVHETSTVGNNGSVGVYGTGATATAFAGVATIADVGDRGI